MTLNKHPLGVVASLPEADVNELDEGIRGTLVFPDSEDYEDARNVWNGLINKYPALVVRAKGASDVARAVGFANDHDLDLAIRGGAHNQAGTAIAEGGLVVDLSAMDSVSVDPDAHVARVEPGTRAEDVLAETQPHGLALPTGSAGTVGISGSTLGGGVGWMRRKHGLGIDALRRVELVTAEGELVTASPDCNEDLFWALRGGGGNFGIVTNFEFDLYEVGPMVLGLGVFYPADAAEAVLETHREVMVDAPENLTTILLRGEVPSLPPMPDELAGIPAVGILGCYTGDPEAGEAVIEPLRSAAEPLIDMSDVMPYEMLHDLGTQMYPWGRKYTHRSVFLDELTDEVHDVILERMDEAPTPMDAIAIWSMGGNIGHGPDAAYAWNDKQYMITIEGNWEEIENASNLEWARETERRLRGLDDAGVEGAYTGFTGVEEQDWEDWSEQVYDDNRARLAAVKAEYDPDNVFSLNVNIDPAAFGE